MNFERRLQRLERHHRTAARQDDRLREKLGAAYGAGDEAWARAVVAEAMLDPETAALAGEEPTRPEELAALLEAMDAPTRALYEQERDMAPCVRELVRSYAEHHALYGYLPGERPPG